MQFVTKMFVIKIKVRISPTAIQSILLEIETNQRQVVWIES